MIDLAYDPESVAAAYVNVCLSMQLKSLLVSADSISAFRREFTADRQQSLYLDDDRFWQFVAFAQSCS